MSELCDRARGADVAVKEPSYNPKSKNDNRVVLVAEAIGSGTQK